MIRLCCSSLRWVIFTLSFIQRCFVHSLLQIQSFISCTFLTTSPFTTHLPSAPPQPLPVDQPVDSGEKETQAGTCTSGEAGDVNGAEEKQYSHCCKVKTPRWIQACVNYRFPASIDPFTSESLVEYSVHCTVHVCTQTIQKGSEYNDYVLCYVAWVKAYLISFL